MKVYRYMGKTEFELMMAGEDIVGKPIHNAKTTSTGVCFLEEVTFAINKRVEELTFSPVECFQFLSGIVSNYALVEFETEEKLSIAIGVYADPYGKFGDRILILELCVDKYNKKDFVPLRAAHVDISGRHKWFEIDEYAARKIIDIY